MLSIALRYGGFRLRALLSAGNVTPLAPKSLNKEGRTRASAWSRRLVRTLLSDLETVEGSDGFAVREVRNNLDLERSGVIQLHPVILGFAGRA